MVRTVLGRRPPKAACSLSAFLLAVRDPLDAVLGRVQLQRGAVAHLRGKYVTAAERFSLALNALPRAHYLRPVAGWNLITTSYHLGAHDAHEVLRMMWDHGLRCRRPRSPKVERTVPGGIICWAEGCLHARAGHDKHAARCLVWAANSLHELGALHEATLCALDLVALEPQGLPKVIKVVRALAQDIGTPQTVRDAAMAWVCSPAPKEALVLRAQLLERGNAVRQPD